MSQILIAAGLTAPDHFLEKIVQVSFDLPEISASGAKAFVTSLVAGTDLERLAGEDDLEPISHVLGTPDPRHAKRFLNDLSVRLAVLRNTGRLGEEESQLTESAVLSWHLLLESLPPDRRREVTRNTGNLESFLRQVALVKGKEDAGEKPEGVSEEAFSKKEVCSG